jgi:hypothetical protein
MSTSTLPATTDLPKQVSDLQARVAALEAVIQIISPGTVRLKAVNSITIETGTFTMQTDTSATFRVGSNLTMRAAYNADIRAGLAMLLSGATTMTIRGATVNIN